MYYVITTVSKNGKVGGVISRNREFAVRLYNEAWSKPGVVDVWLIDGQHNQIVNPRHLTA